MCRIFRSLGLALCRLRHVSSHLEAHIRCHVYANTKSQLVWSALYGGLDFSPHLLAHRRFHHLALATVALQQARQLVGAAVTPKLSFKPHATTRAAPGTACGARVSITRRARNTCRGWLGSLERLASTKLIVTISSHWRYLWASPATLLGVLAALGPVAFGAQVEFRSGVIEVSLRRPGNARRGQFLPFTAMTLGHVVVASSALEQDRLRSHERVHVAQYERWGPFFLLAYPAESMLQLIRGRRPYLDNRFEVQARALSEAPVLQQRSTEA